jgi:RNA polymerase sigma-32 factor
MASKKTTAKRKQPRAAKGRPAKAKVLAEDGPVREGAEGSVREGAEGSVREGAEGSVREGAEGGVDDDDVLEAELVKDEPTDSAVGDAKEPTAATLAAVSAKLPAPDSGTALSRRDPFKAYLREVQRYPLLTREEEKTITREYQRTGDPELARRLVTANLRLVIKLAYEYRRAYKNMMDLIQEGNIGLMQAVKRYDPYRGVKLSSYSAWWIRAYMLRYILNNWRLVKLGTTQAQRKLFFNLNKQKAKLTSMGVEPTPERIAARLGVKEKEVIEMDRRMSSSEASLDAPLGDGDGRSVARGELMASGDRATDEYVASRELGELLNKHLAIFRKRLDGKDLVIFDKRMIAEDPLTLQKLGDGFGVSRERVRQLESRLAGKLREYLKGELGDAVDLGV